MHSTAPAVIEISPPPSPMAQRSAAAADDSFQTHVDNALQEDAPADAAPLAAEDVVEDGAQRVVPTPPPLQHPAVAPIALQLVTPAEQSAPAQSDAPVELAAQAPAPEAAAPPTADALSDTADKAAESDHAPSAKGDPTQSAKSDAPPSPLMLNASMSAASQATAPAVATAPSPQTSAQPTAPQGAEAPIAATAQPAQMAARKVAAKSSPVASAEGDDKRADLKSDAATATDGKRTPQADPKFVPASLSTKDAPAPAALASDQHPATLLQAGALSSASVQTTQPTALEASALARAAPAGAQVAREIIRRFDGGATRFELRLDPPELGRVEVRLDVTRDHRVTAVVAADSPQALAELMRHARDLEQTLQSAGLQLSENGLSFDLRQRDRGFDQALDEARGPAGNGADGSTEDAAPKARPLGYERWRGARVDMMV